MSKHAKLSPSASKRWMSCPGSVALIEDLNIKDTPSKYAAEGTVAHWVGEQCLKTGKQPSEFKGIKREVDGFKFKINDEMLAAVEQYVDYVNGVIEGGEIEADLTVNMQIEVNCSLKYLKIPGLDGGTSDTVLTCMEHGFIEIIDYKHGAGVAVDVENNTQAMSYALGVCRKLKADKNFTVILTIVQPRAQHIDGPIRSWKIKAGDLYKWEKEVLVPAAKATHKKNAPLNPSEDACRFCPVRDCKARDEYVHQIAIKDFADLEESTFKDPRLMTTKEKLLIMDNMNMIRSFIVAVEDQVKSEVDSGSKEYEDHYKLVRKTTHRKLKPIAFDEIASPLLDYLDESDLYENKPRSLTEIERRLKKKAGKAAIEVMNDVTEKPEGDLVIAPISDKRQAVAPSITSDFEDL